MSPILKEDLSNNILLHKFAETLGNIAVELVFRPYSFPVRPRGECPFSNSSEVFRNSHFDQTRRLAARKARAAVNKEAASFFPFEM